jgi:hypothetical protein
MSTREIQRKKGPVPGPPTKPYTVMLEPEIAEWAKRKPGGLSDLVRRMLREAYDTDQQPQQPQQSRRVTA